MEQDRVLRGIEIYLESHDVLSRMGDERQVAVAVYR